MPKFPGKEEEKKEKRNVREGKRRERREGRKGKERKKEGKGTEWGGILGKKKKVCKKKLRYLACYEEEKYFFEPWLQGDLRMANRTNQIKSLMIKSKRTPREDH